MSARDKKRVRLAELKAERSMLKQKQALRAAEEDMELVKAEAREGLDEIDKEQVPLLSSGTAPPSLVASFSPIVVPSVPASPPDVVALNPKAMPNNQDQALKRAMWQRKKMQGDESYRNVYVHFVNEMIAKGHARKVPEDRLEARRGKVWYLPHHGIYHPRKPHKIRVVFDCSARYEGTSLNSPLMPEPDLTNSLVGVLTRFRQV